MPTLVNPSVPLQKMFSDEERTDRTVKYMDHIVALIDTTGKKWRYYYEAICTWGNQDIYAGSETVPFDILVVPQKFGPLPDQPAMWETRRYDENRWRTEACRDFPFPGCTTWPY